MAEVSSSTQSGGVKKRSPLPMLVLGLVCIAFWLDILLLEVQASEAFLLHGSIITFSSSNWNTLLQPWELVQGTLDINMRMAVIWGWGIELIYLVCIVGWEVAQSAIGYHNPKLAGWFKTGALILIVFNAWSNFQYGNLASGFWGQIGFAAITSFGSAFFGIVGVYLLERAFAK